MPERWERELSKLRDVEARQPVVQERVERGPRSDGIPAHRDRLASGIVAAIVFLAAAGFAWRALAPSDAGGGAAAGSWPVATVSFAMSVDGERLGTLRTEDGQQSGLTGAATSPDESYPYAWLPPSELDIAEPLQVQMGSELQLEGEVQIKELLYGDAEQLDAGAGPDSGPIWSDQPEFSAPYFLPWQEHEERTYLKFFGTWGDGHVLDVYFEVRFVAPEVDLTDPAAEIVVTPEPMGASFLYGGQRAPMGIEAGTYGSMSITSDFVGFDDRAIVARVPAGTPLEIGGDRLVGASIRAGSLPLWEGGELLDGTVPTEPGRYVLAMSVIWDGGSATFLHQIEVVSPSQPVDPTNTVEPSPSPGGSIVVDIRRSGGETAGTPRVVATSEEQEVVLCASGWSLVGPDGTREGGLADCDRNDEFTAPAGTPIVVRGDHDSLTVAAHGSEDRTEYGTEKVPAIEPGSVVSYRFDVAWPDGSTASYGLFVTISEAEVSSSPDPGEATEDAAPALRVHCGEQGVEVLTPVVAAQPDGLHVVSVDVRAYWEIGLFPAGEPGHSYWAESDLDDDVFARPVPPGQVGVACIDHETITSADLERLWAEASPFLLTDPDGLFTPYAPECDVSDQVSYHWELDGVDIDDASDRLRTLPGVRQDDMIQLAGYDREWGSARMWRIVRDGRIVAGLRVGDQGGGGAAGSVCRSSGITGGEL